MTHRFQTFAVGDSVREKNTEEVGVIWKSEINVEQGTVDYYMTNDSGDAYSPLTYQELELMDAGMTAILIHWVHMWQSTDF